MNREGRKRMKAAMEEWIEEQCKSIETGMMLDKIPSAPRANSILTKSQ